MNPFEMKRSELALPELEAPADTAPLPATGSRRKRLWELKHQHHCPVIGTCLPLDLLRRLATKAKVLTPSMSDFSLHTQAVGFAEQRNPFAEAMQLELERRYNLTIQQFRSAKDGDTVYRLWREAVAGGKVADALWAAWTHPRCDGETAQRIYGDIHMLSHQAGAAHQADVNRLKQLEAENAALKMELLAQREKGAQRLSEKIQEAELLKRQLADMEVFACEREALAVRLVEAESRCRELEGSDAGGGQKARADALALRLVSAEDRTNAAEARVRDLNRQLEEARGDLAAAEQAMESWLLLDGVPDSEPCALSAACGKDCGSDGTPRLEGRSVLCVGGRPGLVETYRKLVERLGGRFAHHDGGLEDNPRFLDGVLAAADAVICQSGCISHGAYWKLKDHCKRTGKPCVYLKGAGVSSFVRGISAVAEGAAD